MLQQNKIQCRNYSIISSKSTESKYKIGNKMKKYILLILIFSTLLNADFYKVNVKREATNVYKDYNSGILIFTKYCYEYTYGENALLKYSQNAFDNELIFSNGQKCNVSDISSNSKTKNSTSNKYFIEAISNDETIVINNYIYKAKTYCLGWDKGDTVIFIEGSPYGACTSATLFNIDKKRECRVWCE